MQKTDRKIRVLFLCTGNSCRSQTAEGGAAYVKGDVLEVRSPDILKHGLDKPAVRVEAGAQEYQRIEVKGRGRAADAPARMKENTQ